jgi:hypothetical protein
MGRQKLNRVPFPGCKVNPETLDLLRATAVELGYIHGNGAAMGEFLDRVAKIDVDLLKLVFSKSS